MYFSKEQSGLLGAARMAFIRAELMGNCLKVTLNRPEKKNALHPVMVNELAFVLAHAKHNNQVRVVVLQAEGNVFCAGADLKAFSGESTEMGSTVPAPAKDVLLGELFQDVQKPIIAKVHAPAYAGAMLLLAGCHYVVASEEARFGLPEVKRGLFPFQVLAALMEIMPAREALDWCIRGKELSAKAAMGLGLVTQVCAPSELETYVQNLVEEISASAPAAIRLGLEAYSHLRRNGTAGQHGYLMEMLFKTIQTNDAQEGIRAFAEKRTPIWQGE